MNMLLVLRQLQGALSNQVIPTLGLLYPFAPARAMIAYVAANDLVRESHGLQRARPKHAGFLKHEHTLRAEPAR
jgi:hypothetical protein